MNQSFIVIATLALALPALSQRASPSVLDPVGGRTAEDLVDRGKTVVSRQRDNLAAAVDAGRQAYRESVRTPNANYEPES